VRGDSPTAQPEEGVDDGLAMYSFLQLSFDTELFLTTAAMEGTTFSRVAIQSRRQGQGMLHAEGPKLATGTQSATTVRQSYPIITFSAIIV
jgi:hypothetical protein